jgi:hypothetical protein
MHAQLADERSHARISLIAMMIVTAIVLLSSLQPAFCASGITLREHRSHGDSGEHSKEIPIHSTPPPPPFRPKPPPYPALPTGTVGQRAAAQRAAAAADAAAPAARSALLSLLGDPSMKVFLHKLGGVVDGGEPLSNLSAVELLTRVEAELSAAELVHNFGFQCEIPARGLAVSYFFAHRVRRQSSQGGDLELSRSFDGCADPRSCGVDVTVANVPHFPDFYNQWTIQVL